jgi:hypothetical protein
MRGLREAQLVSRHGFREGSYRLLGFPRQGRKRNDRLTSGLFTRRTLGDWRDGAWLVESSGVAGKPGDWAFPNSSVGRAVDC